MVVMGYRQSMSPPSYDQIEDVTKDMWYWIGIQLMGREKARGKYIPKENMSDHIANLMESYIEVKCSGRPMPDANHTSPYGSIKNIKECGRAIRENDIFECIYSANKQFKKGEEYIVKKNKRGLYLRTESDNTLHLDDEWVDRYTKTFFAFKQDNITRPYINANETIKRKKEDAMSLSQKAINRLNGLKVGEERLVELNQESSEKKVKTYDLVKLLQKTNAFSKLKAGTECLVQSVDISGDKLKVTILDGEVEREKTEAILAALQSKLLSGDDDEF
jgi:hypothetical protein